MTEDLLDYWLRIIKPLFPTDAWVAASLAGGDHLIQIDWKLEKNPHKPNRRSRKIQIIIKEDVIDDYLSKTKDERVLSDVKMKKWISEQYHYFEPDHDAQTSSSVSADKWRITKDILN